MIALGTSFTGCEKDLLDKQPLDALSSNSFWTTENDVNLALAGVYSKSTAWSGASYITLFDAVSDNGIRTKIDAFPFNTGTLNPTSSIVKDYWNNSYSQIIACNYFLENIERVEEINSVEKNRMIAEVRFLRAFAYFNMSQYWGGVPLVTKVLSMEEANSITSASKEEIMNFVLTELTEAAEDLPATLPSSEHGRIIKSAALAVKGRLLMSEIEWSNAANTYKEIIDLGVHIIDPDYRQLFDGTKEQSNEIIYASKYLQDEVSNNLQLVIRPNVDGGWHWMNPFQNLVDAYLCKDGQTIENSAMYDPQYPVVKDGDYYRDPRLYYTIYYPAVSKIAGKTYQGHPDSTSTGDEFGEDPGMTGYCLRKYVYEEYTGNLYTGGTDVPVIRYAEVLLSYLECKIKSGDDITQSLLDQTINMVRGRESVDMPFVTETDRDKLWEILKRERRVEFAFEGFRYWDLIRWGEAYEKLNGPFYGMKITDDPENYTRFTVGPDGHYYVFTLIFRNTDIPWPFPQDELDINTELEQKTNW